MRFDSVMFTSIFGFSAFTGMRRRGNSTIMVALVVHNTGHFVPNNVADEHLPLYGNEL